MGGSQVEIVDKRRRLPELGAIDMKFRPLLEKMLQPNPAERPESMTAVAAWARGSAPEERDANALSKPEAKTERFGPTPKSWSARPLKFVAAGLLSIALLCGGGAFLFFITRAKNPTASSTANSPAEATKGSLNPLTLHWGCLRQKRGYLRQKK